MVVILNELIFITSIMMKNGVKMSLQDDYYDLKEKLKDDPLEKSFDRIWFAFTNLETLEMVRNDKMSQADYLVWKLKQLEELVR